MPLNVNLLASPSDPHGLAIQFPYDPGAVDQVRMVLGLTWDKGQRVWKSQGPEILLDMERFAIQPGWVSPEAKVIAEEFRQQLWNVMDARVEDYHDELYGYQKQGSRILASMPFSILGDDPGTGKSKQSLDAAIERGVQAGAFRRIPTNTSNERTSQKPTGETRSPSQSLTGNKVSLPERSTASQNIGDNSRSNAPARNQGTSPEWSEEQQASSTLIQRERSTDESLYSEDGQHTNSKGLSERIPNKDKDHKASNAESPNLLQAGFCSSAEDDSNRIRQETSSYNNIEGIGREENQSTRAFRLESNPDTSFRILVVAPKTLTYNWLAEIAKWYPEISAEVVPDLISGNSRRKGRDGFWANSPQIVISNYEKLRMKDWPTEIEWDIVICDEITKAKTATTQTYKSVKKVIARSKCAWGLTGTPLEIKVEELYNILGLLRTAVLGNYMRFKDQHLVTDWAGTVVGTKNINLLRERIAPFILRRTKSEVLSMLPPKTYQNIFVKLSPEEDSAYKAFTAEFNNWLSERGISGKGDPLVQMLRMRQFCCTPAIFTDELGKGSKFETLQEIVNEWPGQIVIFCFFEEVVALYQQWLGCHPDAVISGKVKGEDRLPRIDAFNRGELGKILMSTDAGGMGLNITSADLIIHLDQLFNPQRMKQREDRAHRIGQEKPVTVMNMLCIDTVDYGMLQLNKERDELFKSVVDGAEEAILRKLDAPRLKRLVEGKL